MRETEATFAVLSRLVHKTGVSTRTAGTVPVTSRILPDNAPAKAQVADAVRPASSVPARGAGKTTQVLKMADKGMTALEIASQLAIPQGEIDLILNLNGRAACA